MQAYDHRIHDPEVGYAVMLVWKSWPYRSLVSSGSGSDIQFVNRT
jgi:hypothetical protein